MPLPLLSFSDEALFELVALCLPAWLCNAFAPRWKHRERLVLATVGFFSVMYTLLFFKMLHDDWESGAGTNLDFNSYKGVVAALGNEKVVLPAWIHYVAFDLLTANWIINKNNSRGAAALSGIFMVPCMFFALMLGPAGLVLFFFESWVCDLLSGKGKATPSSTPAPSKED